jgi:hypothetical protein
MSLARTGAVRVAAALAAVALLGTGCDSINEAKDTVDTAANKAEVCTEYTKLTADRLGAITAAAQGAATDPAQFQQAVEKEFTALHEGLQEQIGKAEDADLKSSLEEMDAAVAGFAENPETYLTEGQKLTELATNVTEACGA